mgnify:CR=1 FL=1|tara:strand:+ start:662 stop:913 length:252 start_codon:yes stop_codon:yes gene_type:complete
MKYLPNLIVLLFSLCFFSSSFAGIYDDWPDDAICTWLELKPEHEGYLAENKKRELNCFERENFSARIEATSENKYSSSESMSY